MPSHRKGLSKEIKQEIQEAYLSGTSMIELGQQYNRSRQAIWYILQNLGVDTAKRQVQVSCSYCGTPIMRTKKRARTTKHHFCCQACYFQWLKEGLGKPGSNPYTPWRQGQRIARKVVSEYIELLPGYVVHHEDRNCFNNKLSNLRVFANSSDHISYHRGADIQPIWKP